jgi:hypothetical protein
MTRPNNEKLIDQLVNNTRALLEEHWKDAERVFGSSNIKITMAHLVDFQGANDVNAKTTITFGTRIKDSIEMTVPDGELLLDSPQKPKRRPPKPAAPRTEPAKANNE